MGGLHHDPSPAGLVAVKAIGWLEAAAFVLAPVLTLAAAPFTNDEPSLDLATEKLRCV